VNRDFQFPAREDEADAPPNMKPAGTV